MIDPISRRRFAGLGTGLVLVASSEIALPLASADDQPEAPKPPAPVEATFDRDYPEPKVKPSWKKPQVNRRMAQDFVIYAHSEPDLTRKLLDKEPALLNAAIDWGAGDWETGLGGASHMGRRDIVELLLDRGARIDIFCAAMLGLLDAVRSFLTLQPRLIDAKGPHGFPLHFHAQVGGEASANVLDYLQSVKKIELMPNPFLREPKPPGNPSK